MITLKKDQTSGKFEHFYLTDNMYLACVLVWDIDSFCSRFVSFYKLENAFALLE